MATFNCNNREQGKKFAEDLNFNHQPEIGETFKVLEISKPNGILVAKCQYKNGIVGYLALSQFKCELGMNLFTTTFVVAEKIETIRIRGNHRYPVVRYVVTKL